MPNTKELEIKWEKSKNKINQLIEIKDKSTINMYRIYTMYIHSPFDKTLMDLFELVFNGWYKEKMEG